VLRIWHGLYMFALTSHVTSRHVVLYSHMCCVKSFLIRPLRRACRTAAAAAADIWPARRRPKVKVKGLITA